MAEVSAVAAGGSAAGERDDSAAISVPGSRLRVCIDRASGLPPRGENWESWSVCRLRRKAPGEFETEQVQRDDAGDAVWCEEHELICFERGDVLEFEVWEARVPRSDDDRGGKPKPKDLYDPRKLASASLPACDFDRAGGFRGCVPLTLSAGSTPLGRAPDGAELAAAVVEATLAVAVEVLPPKQEHELEEAETAGSVATACSHSLRGREEEVGPAMVYFAEPPPPLASDETAAPAPRPTDCIVLVHDRGTHRDGRYRQLADAFASQGWLVALPDFSANVSKREVWYEAVRLYCSDYFLPRLEELGVEVVICMGFGLGALACAYIAEGGREHLRGGFSKIPRVISTVVAYPEFKKPYILNDAELQKAITLMAPSTFVIIAQGDQREVRRGGMLELQHKLLQRTIEFLEFNEVPRGFLEHGDISNDEIRLATSWAVDAVCEFCHRTFEASLGEAWRVEYRAPPADDESGFDDA